MHDLDVLLDFIREDQTVGVSLGLSKHNRLANSTVANEHVGKR